VSLGKLHLYTLRSPLSIRKLPQCRPTEALPEYIISIAAAASAAALSSLVQLSECTLLLQLTMRPLSGSIPTLTSAGNRTLTHRWRQHPPPQ